MKILFFSSYFMPYISGVTVYAQEILSQLAKNHRVKVLTFAHKSSLPRYQEKRQVEIIRMPYITRVFKGFVSVRSVYYFVKEALATDVVIVTLPNVEALPLVLLAKVFNKKVVVIFHCQVIFEQGFFRKLTSYLLKLAVKLQLLMADKIVGYTQDYLQCLSWPQVLSEKTELVLPPVRKLPISNSFLSKLTAIKKNEIWVGFVGRISAEKGLAYLVRALDQLNKKANIKYRFVHAGPAGVQVAGESQYFAQIKQLLNELQVPANFFGILSQAELGAFYQAINVLVLPSTNNTEAFGMVQAEAMLLGKPVIVTDLPGVRYAVRQTKMGEIVTVASSDELAKAIVKTVRLESSELKRMQHKASQIFEAQRTHQFYNKLLKKLVT